MNFSMTNDQRMLVESIQRFRKDHIDPLEPHVHEWIPDPEERFPWGVVEEGSRLGLRTLAVPERYGGQAASVLTMCLAAEELAAGDMGIAVIFDQLWKITHLIASLATEEQMDWFFPRFVEDERHLLSAAFNEPAHGSDSAFSRFLHEYEDRTISYDTTATLESGTWTINGRKAMPSLGSTASTYLVMANTDPGEPIHTGSSIFFVEHDNPGLRVDNVWDKISQRLVDNAAIVLENCEVPDWCLLGAPGGARELPYPGGSNIEAGATTLGSARAAYEAAVRYANERIQGGRRLIEHQAIGFMLAEMATELEASRTLIWRAAVAHDERAPNAALLRPMAKWYPAQAAVDICLKAMEIFGGAAILKEVPVQKYLRDCLSFLHSDGTQQSRKALIQYELLQE